MRNVRPASIIALLFVFGSSLSCERCADLKSANFDLKQGLEESQRELGRVEGELEAFQRRYEVEVASNEELTSYLDSIPGEFGELKRSLDLRISNAIVDFPAQTQSDIRREFSGLESALGVFADRVSASSREIMAQLDAARAEASEARHELNALREDVSALRQDGMQATARLAEAARSVAVDMSSLSDAVQEWDRTRIGCRKKRDCPQFLDLSKREGFQISQFHDFVTSELNQLQLRLLSE